MTRWSLMFLSCGLFAVLATGCGTKPADNQKKTALPTINRGVIAPEEIRREDGTLQYVVRRLGMSSAGSSSVRLHEVSFYDTDGKTLLKTQSFFLGPIAAHVASVTYFHPSGTKRETRKYDHLTGILSDVTLHSADGNDAEKVQRSPEEVLPDLQHPGRGTGKSQPTIVALTESSPADAYRELLAEIELRVTVTDQWKKDYKELSPKDYETATALLMEAIKELKNPAVSLISKANAADRQAARWGGYNGIGLKGEIIPVGEKQLLASRRFIANERFLILQVTNLDWIGLPGAIDRYLETPSSNVILDLRGAGGNDANVAAHVLARFLPHNTPLIGGHLTNFKYEEVYASTPALRVHDGKLVVLVDSGTSGSAEALASALKESGRATIGGATTSGKTYSQVVVAKALPNGDRISLLLPAMTFTDFQGKPLTAVVPEGK